MANTFLRKVSNGIGNVVTAVGSYTVAANTGAVVIGLTVANTSNVEVLANVSIYNGINDYYLVNLAPIPAEGSLVLIGGDQKAVLQANDSIRVSSTVNNSVDVIMTLLETNSIGMTIDPIGAGPVTITANVSSVDEGNTVAFSVSNITANAFAYANGTYYWTTNSISGTITAADFADTANTGSFTVTDGSGTISRTISADSTTEGTEIFTISVREGSTSGNIIITSANVTIADTSETPAASPVTYTYETDYGFAGARFNSVGTGTDVDNYLEISIDPPFGISNITMYNQLLALTFGDELAFEETSIPLGTYVGTIAGTWEDTYGGTNWKVAIDYSASPSGTGASQVPSTVSFVPA